MISRPVGAEYTEPRLDRRLPRAGLRIAYATGMTDRDALLAAVAAAPGDDLPRLVYADWLDENGDPDWAAFIRRHVELARLRPLTPVWARLADELKAVAVRHAADWVAPIAAAFGQPPPRWPPDPTGSWLARLWNRPATADALHKRPFLTPDGRLTVPCDVRDGLTVSRVPLTGVTLRRGLFHTCSVSARYLRDGAGFATAFETTPAADLVLTLPDDPAAWDRADGPWFARLRSLTLAFEWEGVPTRRAAEPVFQSPHLTALRALEFWPSLQLGGDRPGLAVDRTGVEALIESPLPGRLQVLRVPLVRDLVATLRGYPGRSPLEELCPGQMSGDWMAPDDWRALADVPFRPTLRRLSLRGCTLSDAALTALCRGPRWDALLALRLDANPLTDAGGVALARLAPFPRLRALRLDRTGVGDDTARALARSPLVRTLHALDLSYSGITTDGALPLAVAYAEGPLRKLRLAGNPISRRRRHRIRDILRDRVVLDP